MAVKIFLTSAYFRPCGLFSLIRYAGGRDMSNNRPKQGPRPLLLLFFCRYFAGVTGLIQVSPDGAGCLQVEPGGSGCLQGAPGGPGGSGCLHVAQVALGVSRGSRAEPDGAGTRSPCEFLDREFLDVNFWT